MGMYTEVLLKANILTEDPQVVAVLKHLWQEGPSPETLPAHPLFACARWTALGSGSSFYHHPAAVISVVKIEGGCADTLDWYVFIRVDLKNYEEEVEKFFDWIMPYVHDGAGQTVGYSWYEEERDPSLIHVPKREED